MKPCPYPLARLLPHAPPMVLLDEVLGWDDGRIVTAVTVRPDRFFFRPGQGMPAHFAIEWMAQSCGAFVGLEAVTQGEPVRIGFLLGTRDFQAQIPWFGETERLEITAALVFRDDEMGVFDCQVRRSGAAMILAQARLTVYQPPAQQPVTGGGEAGA